MADLEAASGGRVVRSHEQEITLRPLPEARHPRQLEIDAVRAGRPAMLSRSTSTMRFRHDEAWSAWRDLAGFQAAESGARRIRTATVTGWANTVPMTFGQPSGPPASHRQVQALLTLLHDAGHVDFRDARGPMGFTQRQAAGKFTRDEADAYIAQLEEAVEAGVEVARPTPKPRVSSAERALREVSTGRLAAELQRRGWIVIEP